MKIKKRRIYNKTTLNPEQGNETKKFNFCKGELIMFGTIFEQNIFVYVITAIGICQITARLIMNGFLKGLMKNVDKMATTRKKSLVEIRKRYEELEYLDADIRDTKSFTEKYIYKLKIGKIPVSVMDSFCRSMMVFSALAGLTGAWWQYQSGASFFASAEVLIFGITVCGIMQIFNFIFDCEHKKQLLASELQSYLNNSLAIKMKRSALKQAAATGFTEPNVIDIDKALQMSDVKSDTDKIREKRPAKNENIKSQKKTKSHEERQVSQAQIDACDALFDKLLQGISTT